MKIGIFTDSFRPYTSGVVRSIELFSREFNSKGHEVYVFGPDYPLLHYPKEEKVFRFISIPAPTIPDFALPIPISVQLGPTIRRIGLDIIHVHSPFLLGRLGARAARHYNLPWSLLFIRYMTNTCITCHWPSRLPAAWSRLSGVISAIAAIW